MIFQTGNDKIHVFSTQAASELRIDMRADDGTTAYATYSTFSVGDLASGYELTVGGFDNAGGRN